MDGFGFVRVHRALDLQFRSFICDYARPPLLRSARFELKELEDVEGVLKMLQTRLLPNLTNQRGFLSYVTPLERNNVLKLIIRLLLILFETHKPVLELQVRARGR